MNWKDECFVLATTWFRKLNVRLDILGQRRKRRLCTRCRNQKIQRCNTVSPLCKKYHKSILQIRCAPVPGYIVYNCWKPIAKPRWDFIWNGLFVLKRGRRKKENVIDMYKWTCVVHVRSSCSKTENEWPYATFITSDLTCWTRLMYSWHSSREIHFAPIYREFGS